MGTVRTRLAESALVCAAVCMSVGCAGRVVVPRPAAGPTMLLAGQDLHLLAAWTADELLVAQGPSPAGQRRPWPALYRLPARGGAPQLLGRDVYRLLVRRQGPGEPPMLSFLTPATPDAPTLRTVGHLWTCRPGEAPREVRAADPPLLLQPAPLSPDGRYVLSYGRDEDPALFAIDLTDLRTGRSRRLATALSTTVPRWLGFGAAGARYLALANLEGLRPFALFRLEPDPAAPLVLPARPAALLPDGRVLVEGRDLLAVEPRPGGASEVLATGPVRERSAFAGGDVYFVRAVAGAAGPLLRVRPGTAPAVLVEDAGELWLSGPAAAYVASGAARDLRAVALPAGPAVAVTPSPVLSYRPLPGGGVLALHDGGLRYWAPGRGAASLLSPRGRAAWPAGPRRFAVREGEGAAAQLRVLDEEGRPVPGTRSLPGVDLADVPEGAAPRLYYSVPQGPQAGIWSLPLP